MNILFVHQNFPGQYIHIVKLLAQDKSHSVVALGLCERKPDLPPNIKYFRYGLLRGPGNGTHDFASETEAKVIRGESCAHAAAQLKLQGFFPDIICAHPGWGESLFLSDIWPDTPILSYQEFYYQPNGLDTAFDPEFQVNSSWRKSAKIRMKNAYLNLSLDSSAWNVTPTLFQRSTFPSFYQDKISVIHDGIDVHFASPLVDPPSLTLPDKTTIHKSDNIITFVNRSIEPYRGCHTFIRSIPEIQRLLPESRIVIVGSTKGVSYGAECTDGEWNDKFLAEINGHYDPSRVHFVGLLPHNLFISLLRLSSCHVYLTYPFVLSWSLLEAMSCACPIVGSNTEPVAELIKHDSNGLLVDFFSPNDLADAIKEMLSNPSRSANFGASARSSIVKHYSLDTCLPLQLQLLNLVASRSLIN